MKQTELRWLSLWWCEWTRPAPRLLAHPGVHNPAGDEHEDVLGLERVAGKGSVGHLRPGAVFSHHRNYAP